MKKTLVAALLASSFVAPAFASPGDNPQRRIQYYDNSGTLHELSTPNDPAMMAALMQHAKKLAPGTLVMTLDGQVYILQDFKLPSGQMMTEQLQKP